MRVIICGGGVIGACLAYYLTLDGAEVMLVERHRIAGAASGKSGGFLALDWCDGSVLSTLARRSFQLHQELADVNGNPWGYRRVDTYSAIAGDAGASERRSVLPWLGAGVLLQGRLGTAETTAQVTPAAFTSGMAELAFARGADYVEGRITGIALDRDGTTVRGAEIDGCFSEADAVVIAMGPWSSLARSWLPLPDVHGLKGHSVVFRPSTPLPADVLFAEVETAPGEYDSPEIFPRPDGSVYICGLSDYEQLPIDPGLIETNAEATARLRAMAAALSPHLADAEIVETGACYRPMTRDGLPLMGAVPGVEGAFIATGHNVWGMLNGPASGEAMAGLICEGQSKELDLSPFDIGRFFS